MPAEWREIDGARLAKDLKARRDALRTLPPLLRHLAERADVYLTDRPELVEAKRQQHGDLELSVRPLGADGPPAEAHPTRLPHAETEEVGSTRWAATTASSSRAGPGHQVRAVGGMGNDTLDDSRGGGPS